MFKLYRKQIICFLLIVFAIGYINLIAENTTDKTLVVTENQTKHQEDVQINKLSPAEHKQESPEQNKTDEGFEKVPKKVVYGPLGLVLEILEYTLDKLYILFEY